MTYHVQILLLVRQPLFDRAALLLTQTSWVLPPLSVGKMTLRLYGALNYSHDLSKGPSFGTGRPYLLARAKRASSQRLRHRDDSFQRKAPQRAQPLGKVEKATRGSVNSGSAHLTLPVVSKNTNELKIGTPGRFGIVVYTLGWPMGARILGHEDADPALDTVDGCRRWLAPA